MPKPSFLRLFFALLVTAGLIIPPAAFAGTTGGLSGAVTDTVSGRSLAGAKVTASSPSQTATITADANGSFNFLSLPPDTYTLSVQSEGYDPVSISGITIVADQTQRVAVKAQRTLQTIGKVTSRSSSDLVRPGATTDSYSINAATQARITGLGGGGSLNQAYSALAATPGVFVPPGQSGWSQAAGVVIRGGTHSQIGYELDGVPVNNGLNFFPGTNLSTLGQQEVQVYAGSAPLNSESQGLSGFINQVIKTGTYPGFGSVDFGIGSPAFYHKLAFEGGTMSANRNFSLYVGFLGANQAYRVVNQSNGAGLSTNYGQGYSQLPCPGNATNLNYSACYPATTPGGLVTGPGGFATTPVNFYSPAFSQDRENVVNVHYYIPQKSGIRDDIQVLYQTGGIKQSFYTSANDLGVAPYPFPVGNTYTGPVGAFLPANYASLATPYYFPSGNQKGLIPANQQDSQQNNQAVFKAQFQHNMGTNAYLKLYGYTLYSNFEFDAPNTVSPGESYNGNPPDYKVWTHTSGYAGEFADQLSDKHLLRLSASYTHAPSVRDNNTTSFTSASTPFAVAVDSSNPNSGLCYAIAGGAATAASCQKNQGAAQVTYKQAYGVSAPPVSLGGITCGGGPCAYYVVENGQQGAYNQVVQNTYAAALSDQWKPNAQVTVDYGLRFHDYIVNGANTTGGTRTFWFNAYNQDYCVNANPGNTPVSKKGLGIAVTAPCSSANTGGINYIAPGLSNGPANYAFPEWEPRIGITYAPDVNDVIRGSYGIYTQPPPSAFQQYEVHQQNLAAYLAPRFYKYGYTGSGHDIPPQVSHNLDFSWEHAFKGTDVSFKLTPFYRTTRSELTEFFIDPANQLTSGLPVGSLTAGGLEFELRKGSFDRDGLSALFSYTYTNARIKYDTLPGGGTILSPINNDIKTYNGYTSYCSTHTGDQRCGPTNASDGSGKAAACFTAAGVPDPACGAGSIANPYWNAPVQSILDPTASYWPTDPVVATTGLGVNGYTVPNVATLVLNYRKGPFAVTPSLQFQSGQRYGAPEANAGIDPGAGCAALPAGGVAGDPRYPYGAPGGAPYDALTCTAALNAIPNVYTHSFDSIGAFISPSQLLGSLTLSYDISKRVGLTLVTANLFNTCFGGTQAAWTNIGGPKVCSYISGEVSRGNAPVGNVYNPGAAFQPQAEYPYSAYLGGYTMGVVNPISAFQAVLDVHVRL